MANHQSAKKRIRVSARRKAVNKSASSKLKTVIKKAFESEEKVEAEKLYKDAVATLDRMAVKGRIHKNTAARRKSQLTKNLSKINTDTTTN